MERLQKMNTLNSTESIEEKLCRLDIKPTAQRVDIAQALLSKPQHLSAEQILSLVNKHTKHVSKATVYNTLNLFVKKDLIKQVIIDPTKVFYDSNTSTHFHFYNEDSGELSDFEINDVNIELPSALPANTIESGIDVIIRIKNSI